MFGYLLPCKAELKLREYGEYRALYCGLCKTLKTKYGLISRFLLNYDAVLLALLKDGLAGNFANCCEERCIANPFCKRCVTKNSPGLSFAADALILVSYYKTLDNIADEHLFKKWSAQLLRFTLSSAHKKAAAQNALLDAHLAACMQQQAAVENTRCTDSDDAADASAQMTAALFAACAYTENQRSLLFRMGLFCGKIVYLLDAADDFTKDSKKGSFNVFINAGATEESAKHQAQEQCKMAAGEVALCYNLLSFKSNKALLDNIIYLGLPQSIITVKEGYKRKDMYHEHI
ncbi:MAG: DUF5685 family protein [Oscillospiraceae bacterium]|nr:DUF5685 family protein [Oscillospiraceae bacterium]